MAATLELRALFLHGPMLASEAVVGKWTRIVRRARSQQIGGRGVLRKPDPWSDP